MYVVINGGGKVGSYLARQLLDNGHAVAMIEKRADISHKLIGELGGRGLIILGDGCDSVVQEDAGVGRADVFVSATGDDDDNLVACQLAKVAFGVPRTIGRVNNPKNERIFNTLGIEAISSTTIISRLIEEESTVGDIHTIMALRKGNMAIVEIELPTDRCTVCGKAISALNLPSDCRIIALMRGEETIQTTGATELQPGDVVIAFTNINHERALKKALTGA